MTRLKLEDARTHLATLWAIGSAIIFMILVLQSIIGVKFAGHLQELWSWFIPTVTPSLALMLGVIGVDALSPRSDDRRVKRGFYKLSLGFSSFYLTVLALTVLLEPISATPGLKLLMLSNYWLSPLQGLVVAALGVLFTTQESTHPDSSTSPSARSREST